MDAERQEPKERPILFSTPMVKALLEGRKTQTRRIVKTQPGAEVVTIDEEDGGYWLGDTAAGIDNGDASAWQGRCPYGKPGDLLWVRETWRPVMEGWASYVEFAAGGGDLEKVNRDQLATLKRLALRFPGANKERRSEAWHPSIHMPRWASRITLMVADIRVERLQVISEYDAKAEGVPARPVSTAEPEHVVALACAGRPHAAVYALLWDAINGAGSWKSNPWVWVVTFERLEVSGGR